MTERRESERRSTFLRVQFGGIREFLDSYIGNISSGGLLLKTSKPLTRGEQVDLHIRLEDLLEPIRVQCKVVWAQEVMDNDTMEFLPAYGCQFIEMKPGDMDRIVQKVQEMH